MKKLLFLAVGMVLAAGCASAPAPRTEASTSGIRAAEEVGAAKVPQAALHLRLAKDELAMANSWISKGDMTRASSLLRRAEVDAELAVLLAREDSEKNAAADAMERVRTLRLENNLTEEIDNS